MTIQDLGGAFILLAAITLYGFGLVVVGRRVAHVKKQTNKQSFASLTTLSHHTLPTENLLEVTDGLLASKGGRRNPSVSSRRYSVGRV